MIVIVVKMIIYMQMNMDFALAKAVSSGVKDIDKTWENEVGYE